MIPDASSAPYLIISNGIAFTLEFLPRECETTFPRSVLRQEESVFVRRLLRREPTYAYGTDGMKYELEQACETLPEQLQLGEKSLAEYDWWDWLNDWYERWFKGGDGKLLPVRLRLSLKNPVPYDFAALRAEVAGILRRDDDCYSQYGADTAQAAGHVEKLRSLPDLLTYLTRRRFICLGYQHDGGKEYIARLKEWCSAAKATEHRKNQD